MTRTTRRRLLILGFAAAGWLCNGIGTISQGGLVATAEAVVGVPVTPVSYAGVARRSTVGAGAPGVGVAPVPGAAGVGAGAPGVGVTPRPGAAGVGAGAPGVGTQPANRGGPVNRVGVR
jgi:hypothetical protein